MDILDRMVALIDRSIHRQPRLTHQLTVITGIDADRAFQTSANL
jgi:hypothetical protein